MSDRYLDEKGLPIPVGGGAAAGAEAPSPEPVPAADPNVIDVSTRREVVSFGKNAGNHNGATLQFGPDGYMYLALGDGGNANDVGVSHIEPGGNAPNLTTPLATPPPHRPASQSAGDWWRPQSHG